MLRCEPSTGGLVSGRDAFLHLPGRSPGFGAMVSPRDKPALVYPRRPGIRAQKVRKTCRTSGEDATEKREKNGTFIAQKYGNGPMVPGTLTLFALSVLGFAGYGWRRRAA